MYRLNLDVEQEYRTPISPIEDAILKAENDLESIIEIVTTNHYSLEDLPDFIEGEMQQFFVYEEIQMALQKAIIELEEIQRHYPLTNIWQLEKYRAFLFRLTKRYSDKPEQSNILTATRLALLIVLSLFGPFHNGGLTNDPRRRNDRVARRDYSGRI